MYLKYLKYVLKHKWFVFIECCKMGIPLRGLLHDVSKFLPSEFIPYAHYFYGTWCKNEDWHGDKRNYIPYKWTEKGVEEAFNIAWLKHQKRNPHHWQYWLLVNDGSSGEFTIQEPGQGYEMYLSRNNRHLAMFDESILYDEDKIVPNECNGNAWIYAKEIQDRLNKCPKVLEIPCEYRKEMLCDWIGAGMAITGKRDVKGWYEKNKFNIILHPSTKELITQDIASR